jgi:hypothetical protein
VPKNPKIIQLRELLAARGLGTAARLEERFLAGWPALDAAAGAGLPKGDIAELHCADGGGALAVAHILNAAAARRQCVVLVDGADGFDPASVEAAALARLLWVRCHSAAEAVKAADLILRDGNLPLVLLNVRGCADVARVPSQAWYRLQRIVEQSGVALLVLTARPLVPCARVRVTLRWRCTLDDLDRDHDELVQAVTFEAARVQGARGLTEDELQLAEVADGEMTNFQ